MCKRVTMIEGSSLDEAIAADVRRLAQGCGNVLVMLDSNHTHEHVLRELELYSPLVTKGNYLIVFDTIVEDMRIAVGRSSNSRDWNAQLPELLPAYLGDTWLSTPIDPATVGQNQLLLASVNFEDFGLDTYKINYTIRFSAEGWVAPVNPPL
jgi:hypothetical protein